MTRYIQLRLTDSDFFFINGKKLAAEHKLNKALTWEEFFMLLFRNKVMKVKA